jgi:hypothetical protein
MDHAAVDAVLVPPDAQEEVMVALAVEHQLTVDLPVSIRVFCIVREDSFNDVAKAL